MRKEKIKKLIFLLIVGFLIFGVGLSDSFAKTLKEREGTARAQYQSVKAQYLKELNWWRNTRQQFLHARATFRKFRNAKNRKAYEQQARNFLEKTVDVLIRKLEVIKMWVADKPSLSKVARNEIIAQIQKDIDWLKNKKSEISSAPPSQIKEKAKEIRTYWKKHRIFVKKVIAEIWIARLDWIINRFENVSSKVANKIEELKASGIDTSQLENWLADFNQKIELAKEKRNQAKEKYEQISNLKDLNQFFVQVHQFVKEANQYLREAHRTLVKIIREMRKEILSTTRTTSSAE